MTCSVIAYLNTATHVRSWNLSDLATDICNR